MAVLQESVGMEEGTQPGAVRAVEMLDMEKRLSRLEGEVKATYVHLATKADVESVRSELKSEIIGAKAELRDDIAGAKAELQGDIAGVKSDLRVLKILGGVLLLLLGWDNFGPQLLRLLY